MQFYRERAHKSRVCKQSHPLLMGCTPLSLQYKVKKLVGFDNQSGLMLSQVSKCCAYIRLVISQTDQKMNILADIGHLK